VYCSEASEIQNKVGVAQKISDAELIALLCQAQDEIEAQGRSNEAPVLLADFAKELLNQRLSASVQVVTNGVLGLSPWGISLQYLGNKLP
jgi:hypothetical protein